MIIFWWNYRNFPHRAKVSTFCSFFYCFLPSISLSHSLTYALPCNPSSEETALYHDERDMMPCWWSTCSKVKVVWLVQSDMSGVFVSNRARTSPWCFKLAGGRHHHYMLLKWPALHTWRSLFMHGRTYVLSVWASTTTMTFREYKNKCERVGGTTTRMMQFCRLAVSCSKLKATFIRVVQMHTLPAFHFYQSVLPQHLKLLSNLPTSIVGSEWLKSTRWTNFSARY